MTEYQVGYFEDPNPVDDYVETSDGEYLDASDVVKLLNKLSKENEQLKRMNIRCYNCKNFEAIEEQSFTDNQNGKIYSVEDFDEIINLLNNKDRRIKELKAENTKLRRKLFEAR